MTYSVGGWVHDERASQFGRELLVEQYQGEGLVVGESRQLTTDGLRLASMLAGIRVFQAAAGKSKESGSGQQGYNASTTQETNDITKSGPPRNPDGTFAKVDGPTAGKKVDSATRQRILKRDQNADGSWTCATCGHSTSNPANIHTGHIKARSKGGDLSDGNLRCEGAACNLSQGAGSAPNPARTCAARGSCGAPYGRTD